MGRRDVAPVLATRSMHTQCHLDRSLEWEARLGESQDETRHPLNRAATQKGVLLVTGVGSCRSWPRNPYWKVCKARKRCVLPRADELVVVRQTNGRCRIETGRFVSEAEDCLQSQEPTNNAVSSNVGWVLSEENRL